MSTRKKTHAPLRTLAAQGFEWFGYIEVPHHAVPDGSYLATAPPNAEIIKATWNELSDLVSRSYAEAKLLLGTLEGYRREAGQELDRFHKEEWPMRYILYELQEQVKLHGRDALVIDNPPPGYKPALDLKEGWYVTYGSRDTSIPFDETNDWPIEGFGYTPPEPAGKVPHRLSYLTRVEGGQTWGDAHAKAAQQYRLDEQERTQFGDYAGVLRFRIAVLRNVLLQYEVYGWTDRWEEKTPEQQEAAQSQEEKRRGRPRFPYWQNEEWMRSRFQQHLDAGLHQAAAIAKMVEQYADEFPDHEPPTVDGGARDVLGLRSSR